MKEEKEVLATAGQSNDLIEIKRKCENLSYPDSEIMIYSFLNPSYGTDLWHNQNICKLKNNIISADVDGFIWALINHEGTYAR